MIYLDHNATAPVAPEAVIAMRDALERAWGNPSSTHGPGQDARRLLGTARAQVALLVGCRPDELVFTSGATEANHAALLGAVDPRRPTPRRDRLVLSAVEHPALLALADRLRHFGHVVDLLPVGSDGRIDLERADALIGTDVALVSVMGANNETGVCMPLADLAAMAHARGALLHADATQLVGKSVLCFADSGADLWSVSAHKVGGPKGVGALVVRKGLDWPALLAGRQERGRRGGTENLPGIAGFGAAAAVAASTLPADLDRMAALRDRLESGACGLPDATVYGAGAPRLPNTSLMRFGDLSAEAVLHGLERAGVVAASGAACHAGGNRPSHVLLAMGATPLQALGGVRFSLGRDTTAAAVEAALDALQATVARLRHNRRAVAEPATVS